MAKDNKPDLPPEFQERCAMCGCTELDWGLFPLANSQSFFSDSDKRLFKRNFASYPAARCTRCNYLMLFVRS